MNEQFSVKDISRSLLEFVLHIEVLSREKNEISQQIKVRRASVAEKKTHIETTHKNIDRLEEEIMWRQNTVMHYKANAQSLKTANNLLLQFEEMLKEELENRKAAYDNDMKVFEETIARNKETFQSHKEYYCQSPLAQNLLKLRAEKEEIDSRIKACDDEISMKRKELERLTEKQPPHPSLSVQKPSTEPEKQPDPQTIEDSDFTGGFPSPHVNQTQDLQDVPKTSVEVEEIHTEIEAEAPNVCSPQLEEASSKLSPGPQLDRQIWQEVMQPEEHNKETAPEDQVFSIKEQMCTVPGTEEAEEPEEMEVSEAVEEEKRPGAEDNKGPAGFSEASPLSCSQSSQVTGLSSTPVLPFNFSPSDSPHKGSSEYPSFLFSLNSEPSTPGFSGFKFDEDSSFSFTSSFFNEKKTADSKSSGCPEFLFPESDQNDDFQFTFKIPRTTNKENTKSDFPFSFNF